MIYLPLYHLLISLDQAWFLQFLQFLEFGSPWRLTQNLRVLRFIVVMGQALAESDEGSNRPLSQIAIQLKFLEPTVVY